MVIVDCSNSNLKESKDGNSEEIVINMITLQNLTEHLREKDLPSITLTFEEIESIIQATLPPEAKNTGKWWWNIKESKRAQSWLDVGYYTYDCKNIPQRGNVTFCRLKKGQEIKEIEQNQDIEGLEKRQIAQVFNKIWYFLTDKDVEAHKKTIAFLEISILPLATILTLVFTWLSLNKPVQTINNYYDNVKSDSQVEIVNIDFLEDYMYIASDDVPEGNPYSIGTFADIKLRNKGDTVAFIKAVRFEVEEVYPLNNPSKVDFQYVPVTETYDFVMDSNQTQILPISQSIPANGVDRFRIKLISASAEDYMDVIYIFRMVFIYDGDDKTVSSARHVAVIPPLYNFTGAYCYDFDYDKWLSNYKAIKRIAKYAKSHDDLILSSQFQFLLDKYEKEKKLNNDELSEKYYSNTIILNQRGALSEEEWADIQRQSDENYDQIKKADESNKE